MSGETIQKKRRSFSIGQYSYVLIFAALFLVYFITSKGQLRWTGVTNIFRHTAVVGMLSLGMGLAIIIGEIDLSVGAIMCCVSCAGCILFNALVGAAFPVWLIFLLVVLFCFVFGTLLGFFNGILIGKLGLPAFIVTLASQLIYRSVSQYCSRALPADVTGDPSNNYKMVQGPARNAMYSFGNGKVLTLPVCGLIFILLAVVLIYISVNTKYGKRLFAIGSNAKAAHMAGVNVEWTKVSVFALTGLLCGIGSAMWLCMQSNVDPATTGVNNEMFAIAAVVLGGISMSGGKGKLVGVIFGALSYTVIDKIIAALNVDSLINNSIKGAILLVAIIIQIIGPRLRTRKVKKG
jgi:ribose transport system permease protein